MKYLIVLFTALSLTIGSLGFAASHPDAIEIEIDTNEINQVMEELNIDLNEMNRELSELTRDIAAEVDIVIADNDVSAEIQDINIDLSEMNLELQELAETLKKMGNSKYANKAFIGILLEDNDHTKDGVHIIGVTPDGPAQKAGLKTGDIITGIDGESLAGDDEQRPGKKLSSFLKSVKPGQALKIDIKRGEEAKTLDLTAAKRSDHLNLSIKALTDSMGEKMEKRRHAMHDDFMSGIELYKLEEQLGSYFGTDKGLLVLHVPEDHELALNSGDVIQAIDGREPKSPSHVWRILNSYDSGDKIELSILRKGGFETLTVVKP